ncbi:hypothetical protein ACIF6L_34570 [Kitasatospora sp. NPDC086009]|uniref:hypothetical protein n=1 Tax=unclassified Kitasatospora TaxID=2633591 RepID=UPI0037C4F847
MTPELLWGRWLPGPADTEPIDHGTLLEWWPSQRAAERALRERLGTQPATIDGIARSTQNLADGRTLTNQQFYGDSGSRIYLYAVTGRPGHHPQAEPRPYGMLEFGPRGGVCFRNLVGADSVTVHVEVVHQDSGHELYLRDAVVYPWNLAAFGRPDNPNRWTRWLQYVAARGVATLDIRVPGPHQATATDLDTGQQLAAITGDLTLEPAR